MYTIPCPLYPSERKSSTESWGYHREMKRDNVLRIQSVGCSIKFDRM